MVTLSKVTQSVLVPLCNVPGSYKSSCSAEDAYNICDQGCTVLPKHDIVIDLKNIAISN